MHWLLIWNGHTDAPLVSGGQHIAGIDFSGEMIPAAQEKMLQAGLLHGDFSKETPSALSDARFDRMIRTYAFHHLADKEKVSFLMELAVHLNQDGEIFMGGRLTHAT